MVQRIGWPGEPAGEVERARVSGQLGRDTRGDVSIVARCGYGLPAVVRTQPRLDDGTPFPTLYYLTCPVAVRAIGSLEAEGMMVGLNERLENEPGLRASYAAADERYRAQRDSLEVLEDAQTAGGMPERVKCLHALVAHELADANPIGALAWERIAPLDCPGPCVDEHGVRTDPHPGFSKKRKR